MLILLMAQLHPSISYLMPDTLTIGTTSFDVTSAPTFSVVNDSKSYYS